MDLPLGSIDDAVFIDKIKTKTHGRGVDVLLTSYDSDIFRRSLKYLSTAGRILDFSESSASPQLNFYEYSYHRISLKIFLDQNIITKDKIRKLVSDGIDSGVVMPLHSIVFQESEISSAFKLLSFGKTNKKILIHLPTNESTIHALPRVLFDPEKVYIIIGGLGGIGLELSSWMLSRGCTKLILNARKDICNGYQRMCIRNWKDYTNIMVKVDTNDASSLEGAEKLIKNAQTFGLVGGIFNLAMVLRDDNIFNQTTTHFEEVFKPKLQLTKIMDVVTEQLCPELEYFVVFSSAVSGRGNIGQSNYGMANSAMEGICKKRRKKNLPGIAIQFGPVAEVGRMASMGENKSFYGFSPQNISSCIDALEKCMLQNAVVSSTLVLADKKKSMKAATTMSPLHMVASILGVETIDSIDKTTTLMQLGMDSLMVLEIKQTLYRVFQISLGIDSIGLLTFELLSTYEHNKTAKE